MKTRGVSIKNMYVFVLLAIFAVLSLLIVAVGAKSYDAMTRNAAANDALRTSVSYISGKVRASDAQGGVAVLDAGGMRVLRLRGEHGGARYYTYIYCDGGEIKEYFSGEDEPFDAAYGERIADAEAVSFALDGDTLGISVTLSAQTYTLTMNLHASEADANETK